MLKEASPYGLRSVRIGSQLVSSQGYFILIAVNQEMNFLAQNLSPFKRT
jgi:hypothetical protein